jgi:hypothetical protein
VIKIRTRLPKKFYCTTYILRSPYVKMWTIARRKNSVSDPYSFDTKIFIYFFGLKTTIFLSLGLQPIKRTSSTSKHEFFFLLLLPFWILIRISTPNYPDTDPLTWLNPDPIRIRIRNNEKKWQESLHVPSARWKGPRARKVGSMSAATSMLPAKKECKYEISWQFF